MSYGVAILVAGGVIRILSTIAIAFGDRLNLKEKVRITKVCKIFRFQMWSLTGVRSTVMDGKGNGTSCSGTGLSKTFRRKNLNTRRKTLRLSRSDYLHFEY